MKKILFISSAFPEYEGDTKGIFVVDYIKSISQQYDISVYSPIFKAFDKGFNKKKYKDIKVTKYAAVNKNVFFLFKHLQYIPFLIKAYIHTNKLEKPDIIHVHGSIFVGGIIGLLMSKKIKCPVIYTEHMGRIDKFSSSNIAQRFIFKFIINKFSAITTVSNLNINKLILRGVDVNKIYNHGNPVDTNLFNIKDIEKLEQIIFVGRFDENKGVLRVIAAYKKIVKERKNLRLLLIGDGYQSELVEKEIENINSIKRFKALPKEAIASYIQESKILIAPSIIESFCITAAEAMSSGVPVIVGKGNATNEYVDNESGIIINPNSIDEIVLSIDEALTNYDNYTPSIIRKKIVDKFSFHELEKKITFIYNSLLMKAN